MFTPTKKQKHYQLMCAAKAAKSPAKTNSTSATMAQLTTAVSAVSAAALAILSSLMQPPSALLLSVKRPMTVMQLVNPNGDVTAITLQLLAVKSTCLRSLGPD
jgi:hypothetical protein